MFFFSVLLLEGKYDSKGVPAAAEKKKSAKTEKKKKKKTHPGTDSLNFKDNFISKSL